MVKVTALKYGETTLPGHMVFAEGDPREIYPISLIVYLVEDGQRKILVDAGCETMPGFAVTQFVRVTEVLAEYGLGPEEITDVMITHAHHDHIEGVKDFPRARIHIQQEELEAGRGYIPAGAEVHAFSQSSEAGAVQLVKIGGHARGSCAAEIRTEQGCLIVAGDECYHRECLRQKRRTGCSVCPEKSRAFVERYAEEEQRVLLSHDPDILPGRHGFCRIV